MDDLFEAMESSGNSAAAAFVEHLRTVASNGEEYATPEAMRAKAQSICESALTFSRKRASLPPIKPVATTENSEVTWLVYPLARAAAGVGYAFGEPRVVLTHWDEVLSALREGEAPQQSEVLAEIEARMPQWQRFVI